MEITEWRPGKAMGVRHTGIVTGTGRFTLKKARGGRTQFTWKEKLVYPIWLGGPVGALVSKPVLAWVWRRNLRNLQRRFTCRRWSGHGSAGAGRHRTEHADQAARHLRVLQHPWPPPGPAPTGHHAPAHPAHAAPPPQPRPPHPHPPPPPPR